MAMQIAPRPMQQRVTIIRDEKYLAFLRGQRCIVPGCRRGDIEAMHTGNKGACKGRKACDADAVPCCSEHHRTGGRPHAHHSCEEWRWESFHGVNLRQSREKYREKYLKTNGRPFRRATGGAR